MTKLLDDLAEVVRLDNDPLGRADIAFVKAMNIIRTHAAEIERNARDAEASAGGKDAADEYFNGDNKHLCRSIKALLDLDADGALVPHGIGGHARELLKACVNRLTGEKL